MARTATIGGNGLLFVGEDKTFRHSTVDRVTGLPIDMSGWEVRFDVRTTDTSTVVIFGKTATIIGIYNVDPLLNTQYAVVSLSDTEMNTVKGRTYRHSWKRMDDGVETVLSRGPFIVEKATAP